MMKTMAKAQGQEVHDDDEFTMPTEPVEAEDDKDGQAQGGNANGSSSAPPPTTTPAAAPSPGAAASDDPPQSSTATPDGP